MPLAPAGIRASDGYRSQPTVQGLDITAIGVIVMIVGVVGLVLTTIFWQSWWGPGYFRRTTYAGGPRRWYYGPWGRGGYVEEEEGPPPAGPPY